ncbi:MAG: hypothetical protein R6V58_01940 [Planctomycetota bacterium]
MKKKQKKIVLIALAILAPILCALKLGPVFTGYSPVKNPENRKEAKSEKGGRSKPSKKKRSGAKRAKKTRRPAAARRAPPAQPQGGPARSPTDIPDWPLEAIRIDLGAIGRQRLTYDGGGLRSPFAPAEFEVAQAPSKLKRMGLRLQGIVRTPDRQLAIIEDRVYTEGEHVAEGVRLERVERGAVVLTDGEDEVRLILKRASLRGGEP